MKSILTISCALVCLVQVSSAQLIAEVRTSLGNFSINLNYIHAERTVANFMRLAEGTQPWLEEKTGRVMRNTPFYNGLTFHKAVDLAPPLSTTLRRYIQAGAKVSGGHITSGG